MNRIALGLEYDGSLFHGWQRQTELRSVQGELEKALSVVADEPITTVCAGRTDSGVHALFQVVHFETNAIRSERAWVFGTNMEVGDDIRVLWAREVSSSFHARYKAMARKYRYVIYNHPLRPSLLRKRVGWVYRELNVQDMIKASQYWIGKQDFSSFRAAGCQSLTPIRTISSINIVRKGNYIILDFCANAFLHHMVRNMVGVLIAIGVGKKAPDWAGEVLMAKDRRQAGVTAPAEGLYLVGVQYGEDFGLPLPSLDSWIFY